MRMTGQAVIPLFAVAFLLSQAAAVRADTDRGRIVSRGEDGSVCYELDVKQAENYLAKMEALEKAGKISDAFKAATASPVPDCMPDNGDDRIFGMVERNYRKLGQQEEKAGRYHEAFQYYIYPFDSYFANNSYRDREKNYTLADANRTMLAYVRSAPDDFKAVQEAAGYFNRWEVKPPELKEVNGLAKRGGDKELAKEEKSFSARNYKQSMEDLRSAREWYGLMNNEQPVRDRAARRAQTLLAGGSYDSVEQAFNFVYEFSGNLDAARSRARALGEDAEHKGNLELARRFYGLSGDDARNEAISKKLEAAQVKKEQQQEQAETKRKEQFSKDTKSLEDALGF